MPVRLSKLFERCSKGIGLVNLKKSKSGHTGRTSNDPRDIYVDEQRGACLEEEPYEEWPQPPVSPQPFDVGLNADPNMNLERPPSSSSSEENEIGNLQPPARNSKFVNGRRMAVYASRSSASTSTSDNIKINGIVTRSKEKRLPNDGGEWLPKAHTDIQVIEKACEGIAIFQGLHPEDRKKLFGAVYKLEYQAGEYIVRQGEEGRNFYIIVEGTPVVRITGPKGERELNKRMYPGQTFGEVALLHSCPRSASVVVEADDQRGVTLWVLNRNIFKEVVTASTNARRERFIAALNKVPMLAKLSKYKVQQLTDVLVPMSYKAGNVIIKQDDMEHARFHIIEHGCCAVHLTNADTEVAALGIGDYFGELTLLEGLPPSASVIATSPVVDTLTLDRVAFKRLLGDSISKTMMTERSNQYVYDAPPGHKALRATREREVAVNKNGVEWGAPELTNSMSDMALGGMAPAAPHTPRAPATPPGVTKKRSSSERRQAKSLMGFHDLFGADHAQQRPDLLKVSSKQDFLFLKELGMGLCGSAYLCKMPKHRGQLIVTKMMNKKKLLRLGQVSNVLREKQILLELNSPFIISCRGYLQDQYYLYLLMDFMAGGEMFGLLTRKERFSVSMSRFYAAEVLIALEYIHMKGFVYRDLKPENILIHDTGHIKLADMGFCKPLKDGERTYTTCGTSDYMAPEVMLSQGHDKRADFWSLGVLIFEMLAGYPPFEGRSDNERLHKILSSTVVFPEEFNLPARDLMLKLCTVDMTKRLGCMAGRTMDIKEHPFFDELDWFDIQRQKAKPPYLPKLTPIQVLEGRRVILPPPTTDDVLKEKDAVKFSSY
mmetsp:Transcript_4386/g.5082  ORF Transcript_4386/g.5082 Transcript_4386/m.5082 type:complete len:830 (+) Transcript_4386:436-2925(+)|eukprot:CAMPEP_0197847512 /NCGR_PEP_ID=MMETSP1438-20131217/6352_1 /TAXON_ID=1461541 /ORGANISM="Pterosperma sp., Strain CCMP1384" /LENGTH=829 /DNA_ID=CAMNT_0043459455 /DNA_START=434 /DNA_END=2923 /DNA_ORIENTATION=+